jgi:hypothetical protein
LIVVDPDRTLILVSSLAFSAGVVWAVLAVAWIYLGSTRIPPRLSRSMIWREWRRKRMVWASALVLTSLGALLSGEWVGRHFGLRDLFWIVKSGRLMTITRLGTMAGYVFFLGFVVLGSYLSRQRQRKAR